MLYQIVKPFKSETFQAYSKLCVMLNQDLNLSTKDDFDIIERINLAPESEIILNCVMVYVENIEKDPKGLAKIAHYQDQFDSELFQSPEESIAANRRFHIKNCLQSCAGLIKLFDAHGVKLSQLYMDYAGDAGWVSGQKGVTLSDLKAAKQAPEPKAAPEPKQEPKQEPTEIDLLKQQLAAMQEMIAKLTAPVQAAPEPKVAKQEPKQAPEPKAAKKKAQKNNSQMSLI